MLPKKFVETGMALAKGSSLFGVSFDDMTRDELIASAAMGWKKNEQTAVELRERTKHLFDMFRAT